MAAFDLVNNMNDVALRPRLLRTLIRDHIPDDKHPFGSPSQLSKVTSMVKTHNLLSESFGELEDQKLMGNWKSAVDSWVDRLLLLVSNDMPDKCWAGICLLGVTSQECSSDRFLASYSNWFQKLLSHIQFPVASHFVKVASCASLSDLLIRLGGFSNIKKDGTAHAGKLIQPVLKLLNDDNSEAIWDGAVHLLCTIITFFPFSIGRHYESAEAAIASKILSGTCSFDMLKKFAHCLALLPKSRGDEDSWSLMMQKVLIWINNHLNDTFQGFEEETRHNNEAIRLLLPPGKDVPPPFGGLTVSGEQSHNMQKRSEHVLTSSVSALMLFCSSMLTSSYPVQVTVPVRSLLILVERVLMVDASLPHSQRPFVTALQQEFLSSELPVLHLYSLELLTAIIKGVRSQLLPHAASIVRLISVYFTKCAFPELRTKIYSITKILLLSMGVGMGLCLEQDVLKNAFLDLSPIYESGGTSSSANLKPSTESLPRPSRKKRKHGSITGSLEEGHDSILEVESQKNHSTALISLRIAALEALEALLTVGGTPKSLKEHPDINLLLINIVKHSSKGGWASEERSIIQLNEPTETWANVQLAALRTLLASFLSSHLYSQHLAQGLELFRRGKQEIGTKIAEFCAHALLALEVLLHPRALSVDDFSTMKSKSDEVHDEIAENIYTDNISWLENGKETEAGVCDPAEIIRYNEIPSETLPVFQDINLSNGSDKEIPVGCKWEPAAVNADAVIQGSGDELMVESNQLPESRPLNQVSVPANTDGPTGFQNVIESTSGSGSLKQAGNDTNSGQDMDISVAKIDKFSTVDSSSPLNPEKGKAVASKMHHESDSDEYPDLLDVGPDSDSNQEED